MPNRYAFSSEYETLRWTRRRCVSTTVCMLKTFGFCGRLPKLIMINSSMTWMLRMEPDTLRVAPISVMNTVLLISENRAHVERDAVWYDANLLAHRYMFNRLVSITWCEICTSLCDENQSFVTFIIRFVISSSMSGKMSAMSAYL